MIIAGKYVGRCTKCGAAAERQRFSYCDGKNGCVWGGSSSFYPWHRGGEAFHVVCSVCGHKRLEPLPNGAALEGDGT